jgi:hypothetical protein
VQLIDERLKRLFLLRSALELQQHVIHREIVGYSAAVVLSTGSGADVSRKRYALILVDAPSDDGLGPGKPTSVHLGVCRQNREQRHGEHC